MGDGLAHITMEEAESLINQFGRLIDPAAKQAFARNLDNIIQAYIVLRSHAQSPTRTEKIEQWSSVQSLSERLLLKLREPIKNERNKVIGTGNIYVSVQDDLRRYIEYKTSPIQVIMNATLDNVIRRTTLESRGEITVAPDFFPKTVLYLDSLRIRKTGLDEDSAMDSPCPHDSRWIS